MDTIDLPTLRLRLAEAELAAHKLMIGKAVQELRFGDDVVRYTQANRPALMTYIASLKAQIGALEGRPVRRGPIHMSF